MKILVALAVVALVFALPAFAQEDGNPVRGLLYAEANCGQCHDVRRGHFDSPNPEAPPFQEVADAEDMSRIALYAFFRTSHPSMPNFIVPSEHVADLTAYLLSIRTRP